MIFVVQCGDSLGKHLFDLRDFCMTFVVAGCGLRVCVAFMRGHRRRSPRPTVCFHHTVARSTRSPRHTG